MDASMIERAMVAGEALPRAEQASAASARSLRWAIAGACLLLLVPLFVTPVLPIIDLYSHVGRYFVLHRIPADPFLSRYYDESWALLPNIGLDLIGTALLSFVTPMQLAKLIIGSVLVLQFLGVLFLYRQVQGRMSWLPILLAAPLSYSFILTWGFTNFLVAVALSIWSIGLWLKFRDRPVLASVICAPLATLIMVFHGMGFMLYGLFVAAFEFARWRLRQDRSWAALIRGGALLALQAVVPVLLFAAAPTSEVESKSLQLGEKLFEHWETSTLSEKIGDNFSRRWESFYRVSETPFPLLDLIMFAAVLAIIALALRTGRMRFHPLAWPPLLLALALLVLLPDQLFGAGHLIERTPLWLAIVGIVGLSAGPLRGSPPLQLLLGVALIKIAAIGIGWSAYTGHFHDFRQLMDSAPSGKIIIGLNVSGKDTRDGYLPRCTMFPPLAMMLDGQVAPVFADPTQQPMARDPLLEPARAMSLNWANASHSGTSYAAEIERIVTEKPVDLLLMCGAERLSSQARAALDPIGRQGIFTLYDIREMARAGE